MIIKIDCREKELINHINSYINKNQHFNEINIKIESLSIGDIIIEDDNSNVILIIERKSVTDLMSSIKDGRYKEQSYRLNSTEHPNHNIIYLIEGDIFNSKNTRIGPIEKTTLYSTILSLSYYKGFSVIRTFSLEDTAFYILNSTYKLSKNKDNKQAYYKLTDNVNPQEFISKDYVNVVKKNKKDNITPENINEIMLCQIPGISSTTSIAILKQFKTIRNVISELEKDPKCLLSITYTNNKGQTRKINKNTGDILRKYLIS